ncbi:methionyl-tRNA formyltransferase [Anaplasma marginale str. Dawn]|nr:methionyl-tRNA formyltransferase [Anaplasma marginale str. Dawn]
MKVIFMGSSEFSVPTLEFLIGSQHEVLAVYTKAPKPAGRGHLLTKTPVHAYADAHNVPVRSPASLSSDSERDIIEKYMPDAIIVASYGMILPRWMLEVPRFGCINVHPSLLPRWRGAAPMQHAILSGDAVTGVTIMQLNERLDAGNIFLQESTPIGSRENIVALSERLSIMGGRMLLKVLDNLDTMRSVSQDDAGATYAAKPSEFCVNFNDAADYICRQVRAFYPRMFFFLDGKRVKLLEADNYELAGAQIGDVVNDELHIQCGNGTVLAPKIVQPESKKALRHTQLPTRVSRLCVQCVATVISLFASVV